MDAEDAGEQGGAGRMVVVAAEQIQVAGAVSNPGVGSSDLNVKAGREAGFLLVQSASNDPPETGQRTGTMSTQRPYHSAFPDFVPGVYRSS